MKYVIFFGIFLIAIAYLSVQITYREELPYGLEKYRDHLYCTVLFLITLGVFLTIAGTIGYFVLK